MSLANIFNDPRERVRVREGVVCVGYVSEPTGNGYDDEVRLLWLVRPKEVWSNSLNTINTYIVNTIS